MIVNLDLNVPRPTDEMSIPSISILPRTASIILGTIRNSKLKDYSNVDIKTNKHCNT